MNIRSKICSMWAKAYCIDEVTRGADSLKLGRGLRLFSPSGRNTPQELRAARRRSIVRTDAIDELSGTLNLGVTAVVPVSASA